MLKFQCSEHGEQELKDALMMSESRGLILDFTCGCTFKFFRDGKGEINQRRLMFRQSCATEKAKQEAGKQ